MWTVPTSPQTSVMAPSFTGAAPYYRDPAYAQADNGVEPRYKSLVISLTTAGLERHIPMLLSHEITLDTLVLLTDEDFSAMGLTVGGG